MNKRLTTAIVCGALLFGLMAVASLLPVPYVSLGPGPTENTLGAFDGVDVIVVEGHETYETEGNLDLTTVSVSPADAKLNLFEALHDWLDPKVAVVPRESIYSDEESPEQVRARNAEQMETSQQNAVVAALREIDEPVVDRVVVAAIEEGAPALDRLRAGDMILAVDGEEVATPEDVGRLVTAHEPGESVEFTVEREGDQLDVDVPTVESTEGEPRAIVGISPAMGFDLPFEVRITLGEDIGGPSAGLMFALGVVDKLTPGALTGGAYVAGTGSIQPDGTVEPIGGIQQKIAGAKDKGATVFLVPADNCAAAAAADISGVQLVRVENLAGAVDALTALAAGDSGSAAVPSCS